MKTIIYFGNDPQREYDFATLKKQELHVVDESNEAIWQGDLRAVADVISGDLAVFRESVPLKGKDALDFFLGIVPVPRKVQMTVGPAASYSLRPRGFSFTATKETTTPHDFEFDEELVLKGGSLFSPNAKMGDWVKISVLAPDDTELKVYVPKLMVFPGVPTEIEDVDVSDPIPAGCKLRVEYTSVSGATVDADVAVNLKSYEVA